MATPNYSIGDLNYETASAHLIKFDPSDAKPDYIGLHSNVEATDTDEGWVVYKFTYSGSDITVIEKARGTWTGRASLF